jgi:hypothetical protein
LIWRGYFDILNQTNKSIKGRCIMEKCYIIEDGWIQIKHNACGSVFTVKFGSFNYKSGFIKLCPNCNKEINEESIRKIFNLINSFNALIDTKSEISLAEDYL